MEHDYWRQKWERGEIAFHEGHPNRLLVTHLEALALRPGARVYLPFCGKTRDIPWLRSRGFRVAGAELSRLAVDDLFDDLGVRPSMTRRGPVTHYAAGGIDIFQGDLLALDPATLGPVDAIYDRAALVALPAHLRARYAAALVAQTGTAPQLLICFEYDQAEMAGPPFSVTTEEVDRLYVSRYDIALLERATVTLKGQSATESAWLLQPRGPC